VAVEWYFKLRCSGSTVEALVHGGRGSAVGHLQPPEVRGGEARPPTLRR
jgi:hypothetical protein